MKLSRMHKRVLGLPVGPKAAKIGYALTPLPEEPPEPQEGYYDRTRGWVGPNKPDKGKRLGSCNVTACQRPGAYWYNKVMNAWYCTSCAREINYRPLDDGSYLCSLDEKARQEYFEIRREKAGLDSPADW